MNDGMNGMSSQRSGPSKAQRVSLAKVMSSLGLRVQIEEAIRKCV